MCPTWNCLSQKDLVDPWFRGDGMRRGSTSAEQFEDKLFLLKTPDLNHSALKTRNSPGHAETIQLKRALSPTSQPLSAKSERGDRG